MKALRSRCLHLAVAGLLCAAPVPAFAADPAPGPAAPAQAAPLPAAGAAGVKEAQGIDFDDIPWVYIAGFSIVIVGVAIALAKGDSTSSTTTQ